MDTKLLSTLVVAMVTVVAHGYKSGPPVGDAGLCDNMIPHHEVPPKSADTAPYEIIVGGSCYKPGLNIPGNYLLYFIII